MAKEYLTIKLDDIEYWNEESEEFVINEGKTYTFRYTLKNLDAWETKYKKRFIDNSDNISPDEMLDFIVMMCDDNINPGELSQDNFNEIIEYIKETPSATVLPKSTNTSSSSGYTRKKVFTSEIIYAHMALNHIPFDWENRNLNKLMMLLNCVGSLQEPPKKMSKSEAMEEQRRVILERRKQEDLRRNQNEHK